MATRRIGGAITEVTTATMTTAERVVDRARSQDELTDIAVDQVHVQQCLGDHRDRADTHGHAEEQGEHHGRLVLAAQRVRERRNPIALPRPSGTSNPAPLTLAAVDPPLRISLRSMCTPVTATSSMTPS
jgi:hypothetical protein